MSSKKLLLALFLSFIALGSQVFASYMKSPEGLNYPNPGDYPGMIGPGTFNCSENSNCYWYFPNALFINSSSGKVGIGTQNPKAKLEVNGSIVISPPYGTRALEITNEGSLYVKGNVQFGDATGDEFVFTGHGFLGGSDASNSAMYIKSGGPVTIYRDVYLAYLSGKVGIGTASPKEKLTVIATNSRAIWANSTAHDAVAGITSASGKSAIYGWAVNPGSYAGYFEGGKGVKVASDLTVTGNTQLGDSSSDKTTVNGELCLGGVCRSSWPSEGISSCSDCDSRFVNVDGDTIKGKIVISPPYGTRALEITNEGSLYVKGNVQFGDATGDEFVFTGHGFLGGSDASNSAMYIKSGGPVTIYRDVYLAYLSGKVGIGTASPTEKLEVSGKVKAQGFCIGSDCITSWPSGGGGISSCSECDSRFVNANGDTMSGDLDLGGHSLKGVEDIMTPSDSDTLYFWLGSSGIDVAFYDTNTYGKSAVFSGDVEVNGEVKAQGFCIGSDCITSWPSGGGGISSCSECDARFVNANGDTMSGKLTITGPTDEWNLVVNGGQAGIKGSAKGDQWNTWGALGWLMEPPEGGVGVYGFAGDSNDYSGYFKGGKGVKIEGNLEVTGNTQLGDSSSDKTTVKGDLDVNGIISAQIDEITQAAVVGKNEKSDSEGRLGYSGVGVYGYVGCTDCSGSIGVYGEVKSSDSYAGYFKGGKGVKIEGDLEVTGDINCGLSCTEKFSTWVDQTSSTGAVAYVECPDGYTITGCSGRYLFNGKSVKSFGAYPSSGFNRCYAWIQAGSWNSPYPSVSAVAQCCKIECS